MTNKRSEYDKFSELLAKVVSVPHGEIKAKLEAEREEKKISRGRRKPKKKTA